jgi:hypothetical protein
MKDVFGLRSQPMNTPLRDAKREIIIELSNAYFETYRYDRPNDSVEQLQVQALCRDLAENDIDELLAAHKEDIASKMPEKVEPSDKDFSLDGGIKPTYDKDGELVDMGRPPMKHKMTRPYNDGWNAYHDTFKSILKGGTDE